MRLSIQHLTLRMNTRVIVDDLSLDVDNGEIVGLVGESGSGKSMTATSVLGLAPRLGFGVSGSVTLDGTELVGASDRQLRDIRGRRIAMIFQSPSGAFNPVMRVGEVFERTLRLHGVASNEVAVRAARSCEEVLLPALVLRRYPHQLSGGQLQRVDIALALALDAEVLLADEPTSGRSRGRNARWETCGGRPDTSGARSSPRPLHPGAAGGRATHGDAPRRYPCLRLDTSRLISIRSESSTTSL